MQARSDTPLLGSTSWAQVLVALALGACLTACQAPHPASEPPPAPVPPPVTPAPTDLVVPPTRIVTNSLQHVTYTFVLPRPPAGGYIIQESRDGQHWSDLGRSTATNLTRITFVDGTPDSGKHYRVSLP